MKRLFMLVITILVLATLTACGDMTNSCEGVDTSQAPDHISYSNQGTTYTWGNCSKTYEGKRVVFPVPN